MDAPAFLVARIPQSSSRIRSAVSRQSDRVAVTASAADRYRPTIADGSLAHDASGLVESIFRTSIIPHSTCWTVATRRAYPEGSPIRSGRHGASLLWVAEVGWPMVVFDNVCVQRELRHRRQTEG